MTRWDRKLISQAEALELAGDEPVTWVPSEAGMVLRHLPCGKSCGHWAPGHQTTADDMLAAVLRHLVTAHDLALNRAERNRRDNERTGNHPAGHARNPEPGVGAAAPDRGDGAAPGGAAPGTAGRRVRRAHRKTGGDSP
jgi:hypothetical protein